ncbi:hypothetical protein COBT_001339, partial [Conglomerata obtusa]
MQEPNNMVLHPNEPIVSNSLFDEHNARFIGMNTLHTYPNASKTNIEMMNDDNIQHEKEPAFLDGNSDNKTDKKGDTFVYVNEDLEGNCMELADSSLPNADDANFTPVDAYKHVVNVNADDSSENAIMEKTLGGIDTCDFNYSNDYEKKIDVDSTVCENPTSYINLDDLKKNMHLYKKILLVRKKCVTRPNVETFSSADKDENNFESKQKNQQNIYKNDEDKFIPSVNIEN